MSNKSLEFANKFFNQTLTTQEKLDALNKVSNLERPKSLVEKIDQAIVEHDENLSVHLLALAIGEILVDKYGSHNVEPFQMSLNSAIKIFSGNQKNV